MDSLFIIQNQHQMYLDKHGEWVDGSDSQLLYRTAHKDEAINVKVEHAVRSPDLRLTLVSVHCNERGRLLLNPEPKTQAPATSPSIDSGANESFNTTEKNSATDTQTHESTEPDSTMV